ncbi:hypothetical protein O3M35_007678 [Rhynocoris fuscipes]|uniref:Uncharacterized protein n=1 Tax=Rhynocoris fuscipes TaxID=488301 RepID=A0AAW1DFH9_9HEMI
MEKIQLVRSCRKNGQDRALCKIFRGKLEGRRKAGRPRRRWCVRRWRMICGEWELKDGGARWNGRKKWRRITREVRALHGLKT